MKYWIQPSLLAWDFSKCFQPNLRIAVVIHWCPSAKCSVSDIDVFLSVGLKWWDCDFRYLTSVRKLLKVDRAMDSLKSCYNCSGGRLIMGSLSCAWNWSQPWSQICTEKQKIWLILRKKITDVQIWPAIWTVFCCCCEKPMNFYLLSVWVMTKNGCTWLNQELLTWLPLTGISEALLAGSLWKLG